MEKYEATKERYEKLQKEKEKRIAKAEAMTRLLWLGNRDFFGGNAAFALRLPTGFATVPRKVAILLCKTALVRIPTYTNEKLSPPEWVSLVFGWGIGIRTPTNRVRVCRATVTQFPNIQFLRPFSQQ